MGDVSLPYRLTCHSETFNVACSFPSGSFQVITSAGQHPTFVLRNAHVLQLPCGVRVGATLVVVGFFGRRQRGEGSSECSKFYGIVFDAPLWRIHPIHRAASLLEGRLRRRGSYAGGAPKAASVARGVGGIVRRSQLPCGGVSKVLGSNPLGGDGAALMSDWRMKVDRSEVQKQMLSFTPLPSLEGDLSSRPVR